MANIYQTESHDTSRVPEVLRTRPQTLRESIERIGESQQIVSRKVRLHQEAEIRALGAQAQVETETAGMPSGAAFEAAAKQIATEASAVYEAERIVNDEESRLLDAKRAVENAIMHGVSEQ